MRNNDHGGTIPLSDLLAEPDVLAEIENLYWNAFRDPGSVTVTLDDPSRALALQKWIASLRPRELPRTLRPVVCNRDGNLRITECGRP